MGQLEVALATVYGSGSPLVKSAVKETVSLVIFSTVCKVEEGSDQT